MTDLLLEDRRTKRIARNLFFIFFTIYFFSISGFSFHTDSSRERIELVKSIVDRHELSLTKNSQLKGADGKLYPLRGIAPALLSVPLYIFGKVIRAPAAGAPVLIINQLLGAATVAIIFLFSVFLGYSRRASFLTAIFYGLGTISWPYAKISFENTIETFFVLLSVYSMYRYCVQGKISSITLAGISFGVAFNTRYTSALIVPALCLMTIIHYLKEYDLRDTAKYICRDLVLFTAAFMPFLCLSFWYNFARFGSVFETGYTLQAKRLGLDFFSGTSIFTGLGGFLISPGKGFFYYSPVAMLFFLSIRSFLRKNPGLGAGFICIIMSYLLFLSKNIYWHGDWAWGPRYLLVITPFLMIPVAQLLDSSHWLNKRVFRITVYVLFAVSLIIQIAAVSVDYNKYFIHLMFDEKVEFTVAQGEGTPSIVASPPAIYFDCSKSPILAQFKFIANMAGQIKDYKYAESPEGATEEEKLKAVPFMHIFDYWWWYQFMIDHNYYGFVVALVMLLMSVSWLLHLLFAIKKIEKIQEIK